MTGKKYSSAIQNSFGFNVLRFKQAIAAEEEESGRMLPEKRPKKVRAAIATDCTKQMIKAVDKA